MTRRILFRIRSLLGALSLEISLNVESAPSESDSAPSASLAELSLKTNEKDFCCDSNNTPTCVKQCSTWSEEFWRRLKGLNRVRLLLSGGAERGTSGLKSTSADLGLFCLSLEENMKCAQLIIDSLTSERSEEVPFLRRVRREKSTGGSPPLRNGGWMKCP